MTINFSTKFGSQDVIPLYCLIGEAICMIQHLEGALSYSITLKKDVKYPHRISIEESENYLNKNQSYTLGKAIKLAKENSLYHDTLYSDLEALLEERNWLIHKFVHHNLDDMHVTSIRDRLFHRIKTISNKAIMLQRAIEADLIEFSESVGMDMSRVRTAIKQYFHEA